MKEGLVLMPSALFPNRWYLYVWINNKMELITRTAIEWPHD